MNNAIHAIEAESLTISGMAQRFGLTLRTLRFYEERGLISPMRSGTARLYTKKDQLRVELILSAKTFGFSLREIEAIFGTYVASEDRAVLVNALGPDKLKARLSALQRKREDIDRAISELEASLAAMGKPNHCSGVEPPAGED